MRINLSIFLFLSWLIPTVLFTSYVLNQFYIDGSGLLDVGWFTYMMTEANSWPLPNPQALEDTHLGYTFFRTHFSLFFYLLSFVYKYFLFFIPEPVYFSLFIGSMYGVISLSVFIVGLQLLSIDTMKQIIILFIISILTSMNGTALSLIGFPHIEIAIPALILLFIALYFSDKKISSYFVFALLLTIREDAGFHLFGLLMTIFVTKYIFVKNSKSFDKDLFIIAFIGFTYSIFAIYIQKTYFPGDDALERIYLGNPHFAHITYAFVMEKLTFLLNNREYLYIPFLFTLVLAFYYKNIFILSSFLASLPWLLLSLLAVSSMPNSLSNYYAFPFIVVLSWPMFAFVIAKKLEILQENYYKKLLLSCILISGLSVLLFPNNGGNFDSKPWKRFCFSDYNLVYATENFIANFNLRKDDLGNILLDEPMAALLVKSMKKNEYGYLNNYSENLKEKADTVVFYASSQSLSISSEKTMNSIILNNNLTNVCHIPNTNIVIASRKINILESICN